MGKFQSADDNGKISLIKDAFNELVGAISNEPNKIREILELGEKPKAIVPIKVAITDKMNDVEKLEAEKNNALAIEKAAAETLAREQEYATKEEAITKIASAIEKMGKKEGCICGTCFNVEAAGGVLAPEMEPLIDMARKHAEATT